MKDVSIVYGSRAEDNSASRTIRCERFHAILRIEIGVLLREYGVFPGDDDPRLDESEFLGPKVLDIFAHLALVSHEQLIIIQMTQELSPH